MRRLRPIAIVEALAVSVALELDLRMEGAGRVPNSPSAPKGDTDFRVPAVDWNRTSERVLTTEWIQGTPVRDVEALRGRRS